MPSDGTAPGDREDPAWSAYYKWNTAILDEFFGAQNSGRPVYLDVDEERLETIGGALALESRAAVDDFTQAIGATFWAPGSGANLLLSHTRRLEWWLREGRRDRPPFVALLAFFSHVASQMHHTERFSSTNYYSPLTEQLGLDPEVVFVRDYVVRGFERGDRFWRELNRWLEAEEGQKGLPTANPLDSRVHIGFALSQSLLREKDRARLPDLFIHFGLRPHQDILPSDLQRLMEDWVPRSQLSSVARKLWKSSVPRSRMAEVASVELAAWDGSGGAEDEFARTRLELVAEYRSRPRPRIDFDVAVRRSPGIPAGQYSILGDALPLEGGGEVTEIELIESPYSEWFDSLSGVSIPDLILSEVEGESASGKAIFEWHPRRIVVFGRDAALMRYSSQARLELNESSLLLVESGLVQGVLGHLDGLLAPGFDVLSAGEVEGLPDGWTLLANIELVGIPPEVDSHDLSVLTPYSWTSVSFTGGLSVPGIGTWLTKAPPSITVASVEETDEVMVAIIEDALIEDGGDGATQEFAEAGAMIEVEGSALELLDGDYRLEVSTVQGKSRKRVSSKSLRMRSADHPRPSPVEGEVVGHDLAAELAALTARRFNEIPSTPFLRGAQATSLQPPPSTNGQCTDLPPTRLDLSTRGAMDDDRGPPAAVDTTGRIAPDCLRGAHRTFIQGTTKGRLKGRCRRCGLEKTFPKTLRPKKVRSMAGERTANQPRRTVSRVGSKQSSQSDGVDYEAFFDALCYVGGGPWQAYEFLADQVGDEPWFNRESAASLSALGHIDLEYDLATMRPAAWSVAPTSIVVSLKETPHAFLAGFRCTSLVKEIGGLVHGAGGGLVTTKQEGAPALIELTGITEEALAELCLQLASDGAPVTLVEGASESLLGQLTPLRSVLGHLRQTQPPLDVTVKRFDPLRAQWKAVDHAIGDGLFWFETRPVQHLFSFGGEFRRVESRTGKFLAASIEGVPLIAYDPTTQRVDCPFGTRLPGLYERSIVLCSGREPEPGRDERTVSYTDVPEKIAAQLWSLLGA